MSKISETITALATGDIPSAIRINRKEHLPLSDERFELAMKTIMRVSILASATVLIINMSIQKLGILLIFTFFVIWMYFGFRD